MGQSPPTLQGASGVSHLLVEQRLTPKLKRNPKPLWGIKNKKAHGREIAPGSVKR